MVRFFRFVSVRVWTSARKSETKPTLFFLFLRACSLAQSKPDAGGLHENGVVFKVGGAAATWMMFLFLVRRRTALREAHALALERWGVCLRAGGRRAMGLYFIFCANDARRNSAHIKDRG